MTTSSTTDQPELLPCPFCGGEAEVQLDRGRNAVGIGCTKCATAQTPSWDIASESWARRAWNTRLTFTTPTLGDMVNEDDYDFTAGCPGYGAKNTRCSRSLGHEGGCHIFACLEVLEGVDEAEAAPASPIPTSVANEGEREHGLGWRLERIIEDGGPLTLSDKAILREAIAALSPALDNTAVEGRPDDETLDPHLPDSVKSERRCGIQRSDWMTGWFVPWSPRNDNQNAEGPWSHWVALARSILAADDKAHAALSAVQTEKA